MSIPPLSNALSDLVVLNQLPCAVSDAGSLDCIHLASSRLGSKDGQDAGPCTNIKNDLPSKLALVGHDSLVVGTSALVVLEHLFLWEVKRGMMISVTTRMGSVNYPLDAIRKADL